MVLFDCGVAPMWPEPVREQCTEPTGHDDSQAPASAMRSRRPSTVLEMFWSTEPTWISVLVGATQLQTFLLGQKRHEGGSQREISIDMHGWWLPSTDSRTDCYAAVTTAAASVMIKPKTAAAIQPNDGTRRNLIRRARTPRTIAPTSPSASVHQ